MSPISLSNVTRVEINGIDLTSAVTDIDFNGNAYLALPNTSVTFSGFDFTGRWERLTPAARCFWLKTFYPKFYERLRRMRHEYRRRRR